MQNKKAPERAWKFFYNPELLLFYEGQDISGGNDEVDFSPEVDFAAAIPGEQYLISSLDVHGYQIAFLVALSRTCRQHFPLLGLFLGGIGNDESGLSSGLGARLLDDYPVFDWFERNRHFASYGC